MKFVRFSLILSIATLGSFSSRAEQKQSPPAEPASVLPGRPDEHATTKPTSIVGLGPTFESAAAGITFKPPANSKEIRRAVSGDKIVQYVNEDKKWNLRVSRMLLSKAMPLNKVEDKNGVETNGMIEYLTAQIQNAIPGAEIKRQDTLNLGDMPVGMIAVRYQLGLDSLLKQQAVIASGNEGGDGIGGRFAKQYYIFDMTSPAPKDGPLEGDKNVEEAVNIFGRMIDSVKLLDQTAIIADANERIIRTRGLFVNLTPARIKQSLEKEQWLRLIRDGKDIGYSYVVEQEAMDLPRKGIVQEATSPESGGVLIGIRSRTIPAENQQVDAETWMFVTSNRRHEAWQTTGLVQPGKGAAKETFAEYGASDLKMRSVVDPNLRPGEKTKKGEDKMQPPVRQIEQYTLNVTHVASKGAAKPLNKDLSPWYLPQALGHLLPRLVAQYEGKTYLFLTYVSDSNEVVNRFVDVGFEQDVELGGHKVRAIPVTDRIGLEGARTVHYVSPTGEYLGSVNTDSKITVLATDRTTLEHLWKNADLSRPKEVEPSTAPAKGE
jgi:hypothetical protein